jgi:hypothetical protein
MQVYVIGSHTAPREEEITWPNPARGAPVMFFQHKKSQGLINVLICLQQLCDLWHVLKNTWNGLRLCEGMYVYGMRVDHSKY